MIYRSLKPLRKNLRKLQKKFRQNGKYRLEAECGALIRDIPSCNTAFAGDMPFISDIAYKETGINTDLLAGKLTACGEKLRNSDFSSMPWQIRYGLILKAGDSEENAKQIANVLNILHRRRY
mgnify:CR=1 FL=1